MTREEESPGRVPPTRARVDHLPRPILHGPLTRVYVAAPVTMFHSEALDRALGIVCGRFPDAVVFAASGLFDSSADWRRKWPRIVRTLNRLIFIADQDGIIGAGVFQEVLDARFRGVIVEYLTASGRFASVEDVTFRMVGSGDARRFARVRVSRSR